MELLPGEEICPNCKGSGDGTGKYIEGYRITCQRCWGEGKLDWIEMAMGKQQAPIFLAGSPNSECELYFKGKIILQTTEKGIKVL